MLTGPELIQTLEDELATIRHEASTAESQRSEYDQKLDELLNKRGEAVLSLAKHYLPELSQDSIQSTFTSIRDDLIGLLERQQRAITSIGEREERLNRQYQEAVEKQKVAQQSVEILSQEMHELEQKVAEFLQNDPDFQSMSNVALQAEQRLTQNEQRLEEIKEDATEKLPAYEDSSLFQYLLKQKFGTSEYEHRGYVRVMDRWVARKIDFARLKQSYEFLTNTPKLMEEEYESRQKEFAHLMQQVEDAEQQAEQTLGLVDLQTKLTNAENELQSKTNATDDLHKTLAEVQTELEELKASRGDFYQSAIKRFRTFLEQTEASVLEERAEQTLERVDDDLVSEINWINTTIDGLERDHSKVNDAKSTLQTQIKDLEFVIRRCQQTEVNTDRCTFSQAFGYERTLSQFKKGAIDGRALWDIIKKEQNVAPRWSEQTREMVTSAMKGPQGRILFQAMTHVAVIALRSAVERGLSRRGKR